MNIVEVIIISVVAVILIAVASVMLWLKHKDKMKAMCEIAGHEPDMRRIQSASTTRFCPCKRCGELLFEDDDGWTSVSQCLKLRREAAMKDCWRCGK